MAQLGSLCLAAGMSAWITVAAFFWLGVGRALERRVLAEPGDGDARGLFRSAERMLHRVHLGCLVAAGAGAGVRLAADARVSVALLMGLSVMAMGLALVALALGPRAAALAALAGQPDAPPEIGAELDGVRGRRSRITALTVAFAVLVLALTAYDARA